LVRPVPEWIDEEEDNEGPSFPELPMPNLTVMLGDVDVVVAVQGISTRTQGR
jgi:hypothetical protein